MLFNDGKRRVVLCHLASSARAKVARKSKTAANQQGQAEPEWIDMRIKKSPPILTARVTALAKAEGGASAKAEEAAVAKAEAAEANERQQEQQHALNRFVRGSRVQRLGKQARHGCRNPAFNCGKMRVIRLGSPAVEDMLRSASPPGRWSSALQESGRQIVQQKIVPEHLVQQQIYAPHAPASEAIVIAAGGEVLVAAV